MKCFWKDGLSVDESKVSTLMILLILSVICFWIYAFVFREFSEQAVWLCGTLITAVTGINVVREIEAKGENDGI